MASRDKSSPLGWRMVSISHRLGCGGGDEDGWQACCLCLLPVCMKPESKYKNDALKHQRGTREYVPNRSINVKGIWGEVQDKLPKLRLESNKLLRKEIKKLLKYGHSLGAEKSETRH